MTFLALAAAVSSGPAIRLESVTVEQGVTMVVTDRRGRVASRITCPPNEWQDARDAARMVMTSTQVMAAVVASGGRLDRLDQLGPGRHSCVIQSR